MNLNLIVKKNYKNVIIELKISVFKTSPFKLAKSNAG